MKRPIRYAKVGALLALVSCGTGCGSTLPQKPIADARKLVDATDQPIADMDRSLLAIEPVLRAVCTGPAPLLDASRCGPALAGYDVAADALQRTQAALVQVDAALSVIEAVAEAAK